MSSNFLLQQLVRVKGLKNAEYNGKLARIMYFPSLEVCCNGRYRVILIDEVAPPLVQDLSVKPENLEHACTNCLKGGENLLFCAKCRFSLYCNRQCQSSDWERHKNNCRSEGHQRDATKNLLILAVESGDLSIVQ